MPSFVLLNQNTTHTYDYYFNIYFCYENYILPKGLHQSHISDIV